MNARRHLQLRIRTEGIDEHPSQVDFVPPAVGFSGSTLLHASIVLIAVWPLAALLSLSNPGDTASSAMKDAKAQAAEQKSDITEITFASPDVLVTPPDQANALPKDLGIDLTNETPHDAAFGFDVDKIVSRASALYPFLTQPLGLDPPQQGQGDEERIDNPFDPDSKPREPLDLTDRELQKVIDAAWSRRHRWDPFQPIARVADHYDADEGQAPRLLREYVEQNGLQPYVDGDTRDGRLWVQLGLAADHLDFIAYITRYARERGGTKASIELLFLLDKLAEASLDALVTLIDTDRHQQLGWTMRTHRYAYAAIVTLQDHYRDRLAQMRLTSREDLTAYYDRIRITILEHIVNTAPHGYRASDARFAIGALLWKRGRLDAAERAWRQMTIDPDGSYTESITRLLSELRTADGRVKEITDAQRIERILDAEQGLWIVRSHERLSRFGYRFDTF